MKTVKDMLAVKGSSIVSVGPEASLLEALELMAEENIGAVLVIDEERKVRGIFSERDFVRKIIIKGRTIDGTKVKEIMTTHVLYVEPESSISDCMNLMTEHRIRHLPVLKEGKPIGVLSIGDLVKTLLQQQETIIQQQKSEIGQLERYISGCV
jgi:CBS domain-containing protein